MMKGQNCWEYMKCGKGLDKSEKPGNGVCPAVKEAKLDGLHGGINAGRACWVIAGTLCNNMVQGSFIQKLDSCLECDFYLMVMSEERPDFHNPGYILRKIR
jgi:hypothetical protein